MAIPEHVRSLPFLLFEPGLQLPDVIGRDNQEIISRSQRFFKSLAHLIDLLLVFISFLLYHSLNLLELFTRVELRVHFRYSVSERFKFRHGGCPRKRY